MTGQEQRGSDTPEEEGAPIAPFGAQEEVQPQPVSAELDAIRTLPEGVVNPRDQAQFNAHMLQYIHDSHVRLVRLLKDDRRSEMFIQSTEALNRTFKLLHESQAELASSLRSEKRSHPGLVLLAGLLGGVVILALGYILFQGISDDVGSEVDRLARARTQQVQANDAALAAQREAAAELLETVNQGFAANRILENENRAQHTELERLQEKSFDLEGRVLEAESRLAREEQRAREAQKRNSELVLEVSEARQRLVEQDLRRDQLGDLLESMGAGSLTQQSEMSETTAAPAAQTPPESIGTESRERQPEVVHAALVDPVVEGVNRFLADAGVIDLRLLRCDGVARGALQNAAFEIRSEQGFPVGLHEAKSARLTIDITAMTAALLLQDGVTVVRGVRQRFPDEGLRIAIAAVAPGSWNLEGVSKIVQVESKEPPLSQGTAAAETVPDAAAGFDARPLMARLNGALRGAGLEGFQFFGIDGIGDGELLNVRVHHYGRSGDLRKTVVAARCRIEVDTARQQVRLVFLDGHHVTRGREVPFFRGKGDQRGQWSIDLRPDDPGIWRSLQDELAGRGS